MAYQKNLRTLDRMRLASPLAVRTDRFKEWYHFHIRDDKSGTDIIANLSCFGLEPGKRVIQVILLCHRQGLGWQGEIERYAQDALSIVRRDLDIRVSDEARLTNIGRDYDLTIMQREEARSLLARLTPRSDPLLLSHDTPLGQGNIKWLIVPYLKARFSIELGRDKYSFTDGVCYHDHNWGEWTWGEDFGWEWGFSIDERRGEVPHTLLFDRTSDRLGAQTQQHTLALWRGPELVKIFTSDTLRSQRSGRFDGMVPIRPSATRLISQGVVQTVPRILNVSARDKGDWLDFEYRVSAALQIRIPTEFCCGFVGLNETLGELTARGQVRGQDIHMSARGAFEFLG